MQYSMISESADLPVEERRDDVEPVDLESEIALCRRAVDVDELIS